MFDWIIYYDNKSNDNSHQPDEKDILCRCTILSSVNIRKHLASWKILTERTSDLCPETSRAAECCSMVTPSQMLLCLIIARPFTDTRLHIYLESVQLKRETSQCTG